MSLVLALCMTLMGATATDPVNGADSDGFLDGFPDVPKLAVIRAVDSDPVVFDTPSGTVAQVGLVIDGTAAKALKLYKESLTALGWSCREKAADMRCERENDRLIFSRGAHTGGHDHLSLRLEPIK